MKLMSSLSLLITIIFMQHQHINAMSSSAAPGRGDAAGEIIYSIPLGDRGDFILRGYINYKPTVKQFSLSGSLLAANDLANPITGIRVGNSTHEKANKKSPIYGKLIPQEGAPATAFNQWLQKAGIRHQEQFYFYKTQQCFRQNQPECLDALYQSFEHILHIIDACAQASLIDRTPFKKHFKKPVSLVTLISHQRLCMGEPLNHAYIVNEDGSLIFSCSVTNEYLEQTSPCVGQIVRIDLYPDVRQWCEENGLNANEPIYIHNQGGHDDTSLVYISNDPDDGYNGVYLNTVDTSIPVALRTLCHVLPLISHQIEQQKEQLEAFVRQ